MKILATSAPSEEHLYPMLPTLWALRNAGHDVLAALPARFAKITAATGLPATRVSDDISICFGTRSGQDATVGDLVGHIVDHYVPVTDQTVDRTVAIAEIWQPDVVICSDFEYSGPIAAAATGVPTVLHGRGMLPHPAIAAPVAEALLPLHRKWGLHDGAPDHYKIIDNCPPSLQWTTPPTNAIPARYVTFHSPGELPSWVFDEPDAPRVLVTVSTEPLADDRAKLMRRIMQALLPLDIEVIVATGDQMDLDRLTELPRRTRVTQGLPLSHLVPTCSVVINDGSTSSVMAAAIHGVPQLGLPQVSGQYQHADRIAEVGAGLAIDPEQATVPAISDATSTLLSELGQRAIARRLQVENGGQPRLDEVVQVLERAFASQGRPAFSPGRGRHRNPRMALDVPTMRVAQPKRGQQPGNPAEQSAPGRHTMGGSVYAANRQPGA